ncbi:DENN domain protein (macronuclear) [Tetrahymena thermophila SB210]|uniref:DENN domain protein n=1 Tax=Tetrahymena thermophila (strain SB210) TaxID=312017 RepID=Q22ZG4_TETTS|nr:DENN domain protein [Tetrahymena thermophila SB210]EAR90683.1 DENN domain protein [Tetrahymena thermophila SB210]|eukprot:XP_001010928.1 DENN domain protein [Tetrahymena thermophila SB210]
MSANYSLEQLSKFKSDKLRQIIIQMQEERADQDYLYQQSIKHLGQSYKDQVETQKEMINELLQSEESLKKQVDILTQKYNFLKQEFEKVKQKETKPILKNYSNNSQNQNQVNFNINQQLFIDEKELINSCIIEEEEVKADVEEQYQIKINSVNTTPSIEVTPQNNDQDLKSGQFLTFSTQQQTITKTGKSANNRSNNDFLYKSIQSSNYLIIPQDENQENSYEDQNIHHEPAEKITYIKSNFNKQNQSAQKSQKNDSALKRDNLLKKPRQAPLIERKNNIKESFVMQQIQDENHNSQYYAPSIIQNQFLLISNQFNNQLVENSPVCESQNSTQVGDLFFEDFFIIGPSLSELETIAQNHPSITEDTVNPEIYVCFPGKTSSGQNQRQSLKNFCYPFNVNFQKHEVKSIHEGKVDDILNLQIFKNNFSKNSPNSFVFSMLGDTSQVTDTSQLNPVLLNANPNLSLYFICHTTENFVTVPATPGAGKDEQNAVYLVPITYCFMTYYPFISHFLDIITEIANNIKIKRANQYANYYQQQDQNKCSYCQNPHSQRNSGKKDSKTDLSPVRERISENSFRDSNSTQNSDNNRKLSNEQKQQCTCRRNKNILTKILELDIENEIQTFQSESFANIRKALLNSQKQIVEYQGDLRFKFRNNNEYTLKNYMVPAQNRIVQIETEWGACLAMSCLPLEDFLFIFTAIALEKKMIFFSSNKSLLTSVILTFYSIYKPFTYVFPVIFNLPVEMLGMLDAPVPFIIGINKDSSFKDELEQSGNDLSDKLIVDLDRQVIICTDESSNQVEKNIPQFISRQKEIIENYYLINPRSSNRFKFLSSSLKRKNSIYNQKSQTQNQEDELLYQVTDEQYNSMSLFLEIIRSCLEKYFIQTLPSNQKYQRDVRQIQNIVYSKSKDDCDFIQEFLKTQSFTAYVENIYLNTPSN